MTKEVVKLSEGSGGEEMDNLIKQLSKDFFRGNWKNCDKDGATFEDLVFTTDSYVVTPIFFPGGNIGKLAFCGTVNDLAVMGATPIGISLSLIIEEGFSKDELKIITDTIAKLSNETKIPVVTGDTKVVEKGKIDKIMITTSGIGKTKTILDKPLCENDAIIISGSLGDHAIALLSKRFDFETNIISDSKPLNLELKEVKT
ncbi:MAG: AIR synthase related protein, partial [Candidatus Woesearchaeota archaeon]